MVVNHKVSVNKVEGFIITAKKQTRVGRETDKLGGGGGGGEHTETQPVHFFPMGRNQPVHFFHGEETKRSVSSPRGRFGWGKKLTITLGQAYTFLLIISVETVNCPSFVLRFNHLIMGEVVGAGGGVG